MSNFSTRVLTAIEAIHPPRLPHDRLEWILPMSSPDVKPIVETFYRKFYADNEPRTIIFGINPGRFGAGVTGIPFTDPLRLQSHCHIQHSFNTRAEISSVFIYELIDALGGAVPFYRSYYITSVCPFGLLSRGKNYNYYDDRQLLTWLEPLIIQHLQLQGALGVQRERAFCLGQGENYAHLKKWNDQLGLFAEITPLPHPRWVMQYRRKQLQQYIDDIGKTLRPRGSSRCPSI